MTKSDEVVYVGLEEPVNLRRAVLESSKSMVKLLKGQQSIRELRATKYRTTEELRSITAQINELIAQAKQLLPQMDSVNIPQPEKEDRPEKAAKPKAKQAPVKKLKPQPIVETHTDKLERELHEIEKKLKTL
ncbi:hypothetical protein HYU17_04350 [Candidatus Woesearchaeota archaeon]|nr:hypothetical protein [Candidatus Woesearchaeota archaeon]